MGFGKKLKKAFKKVTKAVGAGGALLGGGDEKKKAAEVSAPEPAQAPAASVVEAPKEDADTTDDSDTEAAKKAARARGKRGLSVARSSGTGLNI
jgi:hypothetical protein